MKQVTITERNQWEGETFSYILNLDDETILDFKNLIFYYCDCCNLFILIFEINLFIICQIIIRKVNH